MAHDPGAVVKLDEDPSKLLAGRKSNLTYLIYTLDNYLSIG